MALLVVLLDDVRYPGSGGKVVAHVETVDAFLAMTTDRDGARNGAYRLWGGDEPIGSRVRLAGGPREASCPCGTVPHREHCPGEDDSDLDD